MITVLRLGHRYGRDERISTHIGLVARALGADSIIYTNDSDKAVIESINGITQRFGGQFKVKYEKNWRKTIESFNGIKIHLTMYGMPIQCKIKEIIKHNKGILVIIGSEKVPSEVYQLADYNIAVTNQPHSEIAALSLFLHELCEGKELNKNFDNSKIKIIPQEKGKNIIKAL